MRRIIASAKVSLDGVMQGEGGPDEDPSEGFDLGGWSNAFSDDEAGAAVMSLVGTLDKPNDLLLGRKTYDIFANYWPHVSADNPIGRIFTKANKYVLTRGSQELGWANTRRLRNIDELRVVKAEKGRDIVVWGSSTLYPQLLDAKLVDRLLLLICPIVLGKGKRLLGNTTHPFAPKLKKCEVTSTGVILATYERA
jgi:dihydrofolate reductase